MSAQAVGQAALDYLALGWSVVPVRAKEKRPLIAWQVYQQQRPSADEVRAWFARWPQANVAVVTGAISGLVVLDVDPQHGGDESLARLEREYGPLPATVEAISGGAGRHLYFAHPGGHVHNRVGLAPGIDLRGDGGVIVTPPSLHPSGRRYAWRAGCAPSDARLAPLPRWVISGAGADAGRAGHPLAYWRGLIEEGVLEGTRNTTIASLAGHLLWHGVDADVVTELLLCWNRERCRPPLSDEEVVRTVASIARMHEREAEGPKGLSH
jgi:hypothetical protein